jgi:tellurite resistance protein TehA-like permease
MCVNEPKVSRKAQGYAIKLTGIWWIGGMLLIAWMVYKGSRPTLFESQEQAVSWLLPHITPFMTLTGAAAYFGGSPQISEADLVKTRHLFLLAAVASIMYLGMVGTISVMALPREGVSVVQLLTQWNEILAVLQGLAAATVGVFFIKSN